MEWLISADARRRFEFGRELFQDKQMSLDESLEAARLLADNMSRASESSGAVSGSDIFALGLIHVAWRAILTHLQQEAGVDAFRMHLEGLESGSSGPELDREISRYAGAFPPAAIFRGEQTVEGFLLGKPGKVENQAVVLRESFLNMLGRQNPAAGGCLALYDSSSVSRVSWLQPLPVQGPPDEESHRSPSQRLQAELAAILLTPVRLFPDSLFDQLKFILNEWGQVLGDLRAAILTGLDILAEERRGRAGGTGEADPSGWFFGPEEVERFSADQEWMAKLVLIAKNAYVWLSQLSASYGLDIHRLDQIPDAELDRLAGFGITGLWLIGVWERSKASRKIKRMMGDNEAEASAYSLQDYSIAKDLGGAEALANLRSRAMQRGIRLGSDMVPNHMAIDSRWVVEHPERFLSLPESPFPSYSFTGPDLSDDGRVGIYLEDHYYVRSDAAVVFQRLDRTTGERRYIYHGNDGTSMPWNDTAQLNYLSAETREAVIQTIINVAREFPIIRFDAAMTLAKQHIRRLWFPEPGEGGAIPSRAGRGLSREEFDARLPEEFWREVVQRVAAEIPGTLLLAEAFWMMEGYFVKYLGLHRVYNSAFMHMLRDERNREYRAAMKSALAGSPEVLKRFVNFLNNPDESSARDQFGTGDKYFGVATLMATLPGLPMIGHGQLEGFAEKYGMEFRRPRWRESEDAGLIAEHARRIFPLFRRRATFAGVKHFRLYDASGNTNEVEEDVYAYLNRSGDDCCLVLYHNHPGSISARIRESAPFRDEAGIVRATQLAHDLKVPDEPGCYLTACDLVSGLEYLWSGEDLHQNGLSFALGGYEARVLQQFRVLRLMEGARYDLLCNHLGGRGVPSIVESMHALTVEALARPFRDLVNPETVSLLLSAAAATSEGADSLPSAHLAAKYRRLAEDFTGRGTGANPIGREPEIFIRRLARLIRLGRLRSQFPGVRSRNFLSAANWIAAGLEQAHLWMCLLTVVAVRSLGEDDAEERDILEKCYREWGWIDATKDCALGLGLEYQDAERLAQLCAVLISSETHMAWANIARPTRRSLAAAAGWFAAPWVAAALGVNEFAGSRWFSKEQMERWLWLTFALESLRVVESLPAAQAAPRLARLYGLQRRLVRAAGASDYQVDRFLEALEAG